MQQHRHRHAQRAVHQHAPAGDPPPTAARRGLAAVLPLALVLALVLALAIPLSGIGAAPAAAADAASSTAPVIEPVLRPLTSAGTAASPHTAAAPSTATDPAAPTLASTDLSTAAAVLHAQRRAPFRPVTTSTSPASNPALVQTYSDTCGDARVGDLTQLTALDDGQLVGWLWQTCIEAPFVGTEDELVLFAIDATPTTPQPTLDILIGQYLDGYVLIIHTLGSPDADDWVVVAEGFGELGRDARGRVHEGLFIFDAVAAFFPTEYRFEVASFVGDDAVDELPKPGHPLPTFPTVCTQLALDRAQLLVSPEHTAAVHAELEAAGHRVVDTAPSIGLLVLEGASDVQLAALAADPRSMEVERVVGRDQPAPAPGDTPAGIVRSSAVHPVADDVRLAATADALWPAEQLRLPAAWQLVPRHPAHVAVVDSGVDPVRDGLNGRVGAGFDAITRRAVPAGLSTSMGDHGTSVAALVAAAGDPRVLGANPGAVVRPIRINSHDGCLASDRIAIAIDAAASMPEVRIINLSFGGPDLTAAEAAAIERAESRGLILVAASGNDGEVFPDRPVFPAAHPAVLAVGASTRQGFVAPFSQQATVDVIAPGAEVPTYGPFARVVPGDGTSLSAPLVSGALSLWLATNPVASAATARAAVLAATTPVPGAFGAGAGILDVGALLENEGSWQRFPDVAPTSTHGPAIEAIARAGITSGYADGTFGPRDNVRRGQMSSFLTNAFELDTAGAPDPGFPDVSMSSTHGPAIAAVVAERIAGGYADGTFRPGRDVTRGQMAAFLAGALELDLGPATGASRFPDVTGTTHAAAIEAIALADITSGYADGTFRPNDPVTRGQMASFLAKALGLG